MTITLRPNRLPSAIAIVPIPLVPPWTSTQSPSAAKPRSKRFTQTVNRVSGIAAASINAERIRDGQAGAERAQRNIRHSRRQRRGRKRSVQAAPTRHLDHLAGDLEAEDVGRARRRRIQTSPLEHVGPVDACSGNLDQHFA